MHTYYIVRPVDDIENLCEEFLDRDNSFHEITIHEDKKRIKVFAWQLTLAELQILYKNAGDKGISLTNFKVAVQRTLKSNTIRWAQKREYLKGYQSQNKRPQALKKILRERRDQNRL